jgi:hypothetical protein
MSTVGTCFTGWFDKRNDEGYKVMNLSSQSDSGIRLSGQLINIVTIVLGVAAAYFLTIQSLKVELAAKAEGVVVEALDKKLTNIEVMLKEGVVSKEEFYQFSKEIEARLTRIEYYAKEQAGNHVGKP